MSQSEFFNAFKNVLMHEGVRTPMVDGGGAIALGHRLAAKGVRRTITLARELARSGQRDGISSTCVGGGQGIALLIENPSL
jgi:acetyl-CoA C-acetyltransferase